MEGITIIIIALALAILAVLYFRLRADYKELNDANKDNYNEKIANWRQRVHSENQVECLTAQLDQLSKDYKELESKYNSYHRKRGADGRFVKKGGGNE